MTKILFVCHGNICRSPAAEFIFRDMVQLAGLSSQFEISSAATTDEALGCPVYTPMRRLLEERGIDCSGKLARLITRSDYSVYDYIIGMDDENLWDLRRVFHGDPAGKLHYMLEFADCGEKSISDPWYTRDFSGSLEEIELGSAGLLEALTGVVILDFSFCADIPALYTELRQKMRWEPWYGDNLDALNDVLTGLPHRGNRYVIIPPEYNAPTEVRLYADRIIQVFDHNKKEELV